MKRTFDVVVSMLGLALLLPLLVAIALAVLVFSPGPVFFTQVRVGRGFQPFSILKFRTMRHNSSGALITERGDPRITGVGRFLRALKLDELPQLVNVVRGEMSLVGPRPEVPRYVELFKEDYATILRVRPGITDLASVEYRHEDRLLAASQDPESEYLRVILPAKIVLAKRYVRESSLAFDMGIIIRTVRVLFWH